MHVQRVHAQVKRRQVHVLEHLHQRLAVAALHVHDLVWVFLHCAFNEAQQVLLVHAGRRVDVRVHLTETVHHNSHANDSAGVSLMRIYEPQTGFTFAYMMTIYFQRDLVAIVVFYRRESFVTVAWL